MHARIIPGYRRITFSFAEWYAEHMKNLPTDLLRTFVMVVEKGGITAAGNALGLSQPAISLQVKRLETLLGLALFNRQGRTVVLTPDGELLLRSARDMLALNDAVIARLDRQTLDGSVRLGIPNEFASSFLPEILGKFAQRHPDLAIEVTCALSTQLCESYRDGELDLVFALHTDPPAANTDCWEEPISWVVSPAHRPYLRRPLPLIVAPEGCVYRHRILAALDEASIPAQILYSSPSFGGIRAGVMAGLGVTVLAESIIPEGLERLADTRRLPPLPPVWVQIHHDKTRASDAVKALADYMSTHLSERRAPLLQRQTAV